ncbi:MAG: dimethylarginine dimethylaminohydrolase family protein [Acidimicrobiales bacterium]
MSAPLERVALRRPGAILEADHERWHYSKPIDGAALQEQFSRFVDALEQHDVDVAWMPDGHDDLADSVFTYDPSFMIPAGAILLRPGKALRLGEIEVHRAFYEREGIPIVGEIDERGMIEGGDCFFLDERTLAVGRGFRTNSAGISQLRTIVEPHGIDVEMYDLPYGSGPDACLHLLSLVSPLGPDLALVHAPLLPTALYQRMTDMGYTLLHAPVNEFDVSLGLNLNVLATAPRRVIAIDGFPTTAALMREAGCDVTIFRADELCIPCEGGPTCLTRPILRR